jgi:hypothetical protein
MTIVQTSSCVDGAWKDAAGQWTGAISGSASDVSFSGQISLAEDVVDLLAEVSFHFEHQAGGFARGIACAIPEELLHVRIHTG